MTNSKEELSRLLHTTHNLPLDEQIEAVLKATEGESIPNRADSIVMLLEARAEVQKTWYRVTYKDRIWAEASDRIDVLARAYHFDPEDPDVKLFKLRTWMYQGTWEKWTPNDEDVVEGKEIAFALSADEIEDEDG